jgi:hypothetical protein
MRTGPQLRVPAGPRGLLLLLSLNCFISCEGAEDTCVPRGKEAGPIHPHPSSQPTVPLASAPSALD